MYAIYRHNKATKQTQQRALTNIHTYIQWFVCKRVYKYMAPATSAICRSVRVLYAYMRLKAYYSVGCLCVVRQLLSVAHLNRYARTHVCVCVCVCIDIRRNQHLSDNFQSHFRIEFNLSMTCRFVYRIPNCLANCKQPHTYTQTHI